MHLHNRAGTLASMIYSHNSQHTALHKTVGLARDSAAVHLSYMPLLMFILTYLHI